MEEEILVDVVMVLVMVEGEVEVGGVRRGGGVGRVGGRRGLRYGGGGGGAVAGGEGLGGSGWGGGQAKGLTEAHLCAAVDASIAENKGLNHMDAVYEKLEIEAPIMQAQMEMGQIQRTVN